MKKVIAGIMSLALVMLIVPAYATNDINAAVIPQANSHTIDWDFGTIAERDYCFSKTEAYFDHYTDGSVGSYVANPVQHFNGTNFSGAAEGHIHYKTSADIPVDAQIPCKGALNFPMAAIFDNTNEKFFWSTTYTSFGHVFANGTIQYLNEAIVNVSNVEELEVHQNCDYDTFDHTTEIIVDRNSVERAVHDKSSGTCVAVVEDFSDNIFYKSWFKTLPSLP